MNLANKISFDQNKYWPIFPRFTPSNTATSEMTENLYDLN